MYICDQSVASAKRGNILNLEFVPIENLNHLNLYSSYSPNEKSNYATKYFSLELYDIIGTELKISIL